MNKSTCARKESKKKSTQEYIQAQQDGRNIFKQELSTELSSISKDAATLCVVLSF